MNNWQKLVVFISKLRSQIDAAKPGKDPKKKQHLDSFNRKITHIFGQTSEEAVCKFLACLEQYAPVREMSNSTSYWVRALERLWGEFW
jgi:hypothetical protein